MGIATNSEAPAGSTHISIDTPQLLFVVDTDMDYGQTASDDSPVILLSYLEDYNCGIYFPGQGLFWCTFLVESCMKIAIMKNKY